MVCGVQVDHPFGLAGHSDADVGVHALMDALLGASGRGDIGALFPDDDAAFEGISSLALLETVMSHLSGDGWAIGNVDVTLVCERPRLSGYRSSMCETLASVLGLEAGAVNVKATTTEGMGFEGRGEGIAAFAVCLLFRAELRGGGEAQAAPGQ
jgi:2-C-methyl-D-erythritol 2,4-cyclodiphosphate synthase